MSTKEDQAKQQAYTNIIQQAVKYMSANQLSQQMATLNSITAQPVIPSPISVTKNNVMFMPDPEQFNSFKFNQPGIAIYPYFDGQHNTRFKVAYTGEGIEINTWYIVDSLTGNLTSFTDEEYEMYQKIQSTLGD